MRHNVSAQQVQIIKSNNAQEFKSYLKSSSLTLKAVRHLFKEGSPEMIKALSGDAFTYPLINKTRIKITIIAPIMTGNHAVNILFSPFVQILFPTLLVYHK